MLVSSPLSLRAYSYANPRVQSGERTNAKSDAVAYAGASVDGRNEGQKGLNVNVPEESLGMARLMDSLVPQLQVFSLFGLYYEPQIWTAFNNIGRRQRAGTTFWEGHQLLMERLWYVGRILTWEHWERAGRHCIQRKISEKDARLSARAYTVAGSSG